MKCFTPTNDLSKLLCVPLAAFGLLINAFVLAYTGYTTWTVFDEVYSQQSSDVDKWISLIVNFLQVTISTTAIFSILFRWPYGVGLLYAGFKVVFVAVVLNYISGAIVWLLEAFGVGLEEGDEVEYDGSRVTLMVVSTLLVASLVGTSYWLFSAVKSLMVVLAVGGSGWRTENYIQVRKRLRKERYLANAGLSNVSENSTCSDSVSERVILQQEL